MHQSKKILAALIAGTLASGSAFATNGYAPHGIGMKSKGMGGTFIAHQGDAVATGGNPAGSAWMDDRVDVGVDVFRPIREAEITGSGAPGVDGTYDGSGLKIFPIPEFGYRRGLNNNLAFAFSLFGNGGMNTDYKKGIPLFGERSGIDLAQLFLVPSLSYRVNNNSFGIGLNLVAQRFKANGLQNFTGKNSIPNPNFDPTNPATGGPVLDPQFSESPDKVTNNDSEWSYGAGVRVGWMGKINNMVTLGATYQSRTYMSEFDDYAGLFAEQGDFDVPANYGVGISVQATPALLLTADIMRIQYSDIDSIANDLHPFNCDKVGGSDPTGCLGGNNGSGFGWDDMTIYKIGGEYQVNSNLVLRAGYNHGDQPIPASQTFFNILAPATVEDHLTLGGTWTFSSGMELTATYMHAFENTVDGRNSIPAPFGGGEANIKMYQDSIGLAASWKL